MNFNKLKKQKGFTIVELLIVIVVIGILAAITIVAYNGIQSRGRAASAESLASNIAKKAEIYYIEPTTTGYPATLAALTGAASSTTYAVESSSVSPATSLTAATASLEKAILFKKCGHTGSATAATSAATVTVQTGVRVEYWDNGAVNASLAGTTTGWGNPPTNTFPISCWISNS